MLPVEPELLTLRAYARRRGVTPAAVRQALHAGRIVGVKSGKYWRIDPDAADVAWAARSDLAQQERGALVQVANTLTRADAVRGAGDVEDGGTLLAQKERVQTLKAELLELELAERRGDLVRVADVERAYAEKLIAAREAFLALPDRLAAKITAESDATRVHAMLADEIRAAMALLGDAARA